jgi:hypothetical protein
MISEKDIRRAIRLAIKAKQIEKNPIIEEEEDFGVITVKEQPTFTTPISPEYDSFYNKLKGAMKDRWPKYNFEEG